MVSALTLLAPVLLMQTGKIDNADAKVISAAMVSFYQPSWWLLDEWEGGKYINLRTNWHQKTRPEFDETLKKIMQRVSKDPRAGDDLAALKKINGSNGEGTGTPELVPIAKLAFESRIRVSEHARAKPTETLPANWKDRADKVDGWLDPVSYSRNGSYAIVLMKGIPWSLHTADLAFVMQRGEKGWTVMVVSPTYYW